MNHLFIHDEGFRKNGYNLVAGIDEAGRGPLAGPVVAAAVILSPKCYIEKLNDSKKLNAKQRNELYEIICKEAIDIGIGIIDVPIIDKINILSATLLAMKKACYNLKHTPEYVLIDGPFLPKIDTPKSGIINGDNCSALIASASIIAKVTRDKIMVKFHKKYPLYGFDKHKGYGTSLHLSALRQHGPCPIHRKSFYPVRNWNIINEQTPLERTEL